MPKINPHSMAGLRKRLAITQKALAYYANQFHFDIVGSDGIRRTRILDNGAIAKQALDETMTDVQVSKHLARCKKEDYDSR